ncbi:hypothetical protein H9P43_007033 [Blastocladiella emersonii ATCC 22665]|nr:hypothetical protein H9P43_007033 [Blastocladiella emersonii ATCC 22665]
MSSTSRSNTPASTIPPPPPYTPNTNIPATNETGIEPPAYTPAVVPRTSSRTRSGSVSSASSSTSSSSGKGKAKPFRAHPGETSLADVLERVAAWVTPTHVAPPQHVVLLGDDGVPLAAVEQLLAPHVGAFADVKLTRDVTYRSAASQTHAVKVFPHTSGKHAAMLARVWDSASLILYVLDPHRAMATAAAHDAGQQLPAGPQLPKAVCDLLGRARGPSVTFICLGSPAEQAMSQRDFVGLELPRPVVLLDEAGVAAGGDQTLQAAFDRLWVTAQETAREERQLAAASAAASSSATASRTVPRAVIRGKTKGKVAPM